MSWLLLTFWVYCLPRSFLDITFKTYWIPQSSQKPRYSLPLSIPHPALGLCTSFPLSWMSFTSPGNAWIPVLPQVTYLIPQYLSLPVSKAVCKSHLACGSCQCIAMIVHKFFSFSGTRALEEGAFVSLYIWNSGKRFLWSLPYNKILGVGMSKRFLMRS